MFCLHGHITVLGFEDIASLAIGHSLHVRHLVGREVVIPDFIADVLLRHHTVPLASGNVRVVGGAEQRVADESLSDALCPEVGIGIIVCCQLQVHSVSIVHLVDVRQGLHGEENDLLVRVAVGSVDGDVLSECLCFETYEIVGHLFPFTSIDVIGRGVHHLGGSTA